jgi:hypothetical protein
MEPVSKGLGKEESVPKGSGETEPAPLESGKAEPAPKGLVDTEPAPLGSDMAEPMPKGSNEAVALGTLIPVPDKASLRISTHLSLTLSISCHLLGHQGEFWLPGKVQPFWEHGLQ